MMIRVIFLGLPTYVFLTLSFVTAGEISCEELIRDSEILWMDDNFDESDKLLDEAKELCPNRAELYWRKARNEYLRLEAIPREEKPDDDVLIERYLALETLADKCIDLDKEDGLCWLFKGVAIGRRGTTQGVLKSLFLAAEVEEAWLKTASLKPQYRAENGAANGLGDCYYALGMYYRTVPEWLCYFPLKQIIGTCGSLEKSVEYQRKAVACEPMSVGYHKELAVSLLCHGQEYKRPEEIEEAKRILEDLQSLPELKPTCKIDKEHARMLLEDPSLACGYQRDIQQELSKEAYKEDE
jgi:tetratricopeptide (TPR) repeat protein